MRNTATKEAMMAAMMLPGAVPAVLRVAHGGTRLGRAAVFLGSYLAVWSLVGVVLYALYRARAVIDVPLALAIIAFGVLIIVDPASVRGLTPAL